MSTTLSELFQKSEGRPVTYDGELVYGIFDIPVEAGHHKCEFRRVRASQRLVSGMNFKCKGGIFEVADTETAQMTLWADTSPEIVQFNVHSKKKFIMRLWNKWRYENVSNAWLGNSGMRVRSNNFRYRFECSQGFGEVDFSAFVAELILES